MYGISKLVSWWASRRPSGSGKNYAGVTVVYKIVKTILEQRRMSQETLASQLGVKQVQISRWVSGSSGRSFSAYCEKLRRYAKEHKDEWLALMASPEARTAISDLEGILVFTEDAYVPHDTWVISERPAELDRKALRDKIVDALKHRATQQSGAPFLVYWVPTSKKRAISDLFGEFQLAGIEMSSINDHIRVVETPEHVSLLPVTIVRPHHDDRIGLVSTRLNSSSGVRVSVLPRETTLHFYTLLRPIYNELRLSEKKEYGTMEGQKWRLVPLEELKN